MGGLSVWGTKDLLVCHLNVQSIRNKLDFLAVELGKYDILTVGETWLDQNIESNLLFIPTYQTPIRLDRDGMGGVLQFMSKTTSHFFLVMI